MEGEGHMSSIVHLVHIMHDFFLGGGTWGTWDLWRGAGPPVATPLRKGNKYREFKYFL